MHIRIEARHARYLATALLPAVSRDDITPVLTGANITLEGGKLRASSTDRYRVHSVLLDAIEHEDIREDWSAIISHAALTWISKNAGVYLRRNGPLAPVVDFHFFESAKAGRSQPRVEITIREDAEADLDQISLRTELITGNFPPVHRLFDDARAAELVAGEASLDLSFLASVRAPNDGSTRFPQIRFTAGKNNKRGVVHISYGPHAEALIQPSAA